MTAISIRVISDGNNIIVRDLKSSSTFRDMKNVIKDKLNIAAFKILHGFPPKLLIADDCQSLENCGIKNGDTVRIEKERVLDISDSYKDVDNYEFNFDLVPGYMKEQRIPADDSCLFRSISFVVSGMLTSDSMIPMRELVVGVIRNNPDKYTEAYLDKPVDEYCTWIMKNESWGGGIEIEIFCELYEIEIAVGSIETAVVTVFGQSHGYRKRVFLTFNGAHYNAVYMKLNDGTVQTQFEVENVFTVPSLKQLLIEEKLKNNFVHIFDMKVQCSQCMKILLNSFALTEHSHRTGHKKYEQIR